MITKMKGRLKNFGAVEAAAFISGLVLMSFELAAARVLAPSIGSSTYVWTSVIGVVVAALSFGYYIGGGLADARARRSDIAWLLLAAAGLIGLSSAAGQGVLGWVAQAFSDPRLQGLVASAVLFAPVSFCLGAVSPYLVKVRVQRLETAGQSVASLSALNAIGGITGTFLTGFIMFGYFGVSLTLLLLIGLLIAAAGLLLPKGRAPSVAAVGIAASLLVSPVRPAGMVAAVDTPSARYEIFEQRDISSGQAYRYLVMGPEGAQSGVDVAQPGRLLFWYTREMARLAGAQSPNGRILMLGGGAYTLPAALAKAFPESVIDVVEIDPRLADIARTYFSYRQAPNVRHIAADARSFVNTTKASYDVVLVDVYSDAEMPFSLLTREYGEALRRIVRPSGVVIVNAITGMGKACRPLSDALAGAYRPVFTRAYYLSTPEKPGDDSRQNTIFVFSNAPAPAGYTAFVPRPQASGYSDTFMPVERLAQECRQGS